MKIDDNELTVIIVKMTNVSPTTTTVAMSAC